MDRNDSRDLGLLLLRLMLAAVFVYHGQAKLFGGLDGFAGALAGMGVPAPQVAAVLAALAEFGGGLALALGLAFRFTLPPLVFTMLVASFKAHGGRFSLQDGGMEYALTLAVAVSALILTGPGRFTVTALRGAAPAPAGAGEGA